MEKYETSDIVLAACLRLLCIEMVDIEVIGNKGTFIFANVDPNIINEYDLGRCNVEPVAFNNAIKQLTTSVKRMTQRNR